MRHPDVAQGSQNLQCLVRRSAVTGILPPEIEETFLTAKNTFRFSDVLFMQGRVGTVENGTDRTGQTGRDGGRDGAGRHRTGRMGRTGKGKNGSERDGTDGWDGDRGRFDVVKYRFFYTPESFLDVRACGSCTAMQMWLYIVILSRVPLCGIEHSGKEQGRLETVSHAIRVRPQPGASCSSSSALPSSCSSSCGCYKTIFSETGGHADRHQRRTGSAACSSERSFS